MRRGRGKGKKQNAYAREDRGSDEEEKIPSYRRRGRPQKPMRDDFEEEEEEDEEEMVEKIEDEEEEVDDDTIISKDLKNERKRKIPNGSNTTDINEEESGLGSKSSTEIQRKRHLLALDKMEAGGKANRDELLKLLWNVMEFEKPSVNNFKKQDAKLT